MEREQWFEERRKGIGGSDAAKVMGLSRWGGPFSVYQDKVNGVKAPVDSEAVHFGNVLEDVVAQEFSRREGVKVRRRNSMTFSEEYPFMMANIDRELVGAKIGLECKTASAYKSGEWEGDELPDEYYVQVQHYCSVMDWEGCWIACLIGGQRFVYKYVPRNESFIGDMIAQERDFWEGHVIPQNPPPIGLFDENIVGLMGQEDRTVLEPTPEDMELARELSGVRAAYGELETRKKALELVLKGRIGEHLGLDGIATWNTTRPSLVTDWEAVAKELAPSAELIEKHTTRKEGIRRFLFKFKEAV